jgi:hypothetical protein
MRVGPSAGIEEGALRTIVLTGTPGIRLIPQ